MSYFGAVNVNVFEHRKSGYNGHTAMNAIRYDTIEEFNVDFRVHAARKILAGAH